MKKRNLFSYLLSLLGEKRRSTSVQLSSESIENLKSRLNTLMDKDKPYLQKGYHMREMAEDLQVPVYQLSAFVNRELGLRFTDYMNKFRISYCVELMKKCLRPRPNLQALADKCGFNNRNSFTAAFKKFTGLKPSDYLKRI